MREIGLEELKKIQIEILDYVSAFCIKNGINYWLDSGTLLGAIRHKGFIPWDDDIDIGMLRSDYEKFIKIFNDESGRYQLHCIENDSEYIFPFAKIYDTDTVLYEPDENGDKMSINIDVFAFDNFSGNEKQLNKTFVKRDRYRKCLEIKSIKKPEGNFIKRFLLNLKWMPIKLHSKKYYVEKILSNAKKYQDKDSATIGNFCGYFKAYCTKEVFNEFIDVEFEGKLYKAPIGYDKWLRAFYGDYMQLPPEEKRVSTHVFKAFIKD